MIKHLVLLILLLCNTVLASAQITVTGCVRDSVSNEPLGMANVTIMRGGKPIDFTRTTNEGKFNIKANVGDRLSITYMGYKKQIIPISSDNYLLVKLSPVSFTLKEVQVKAGRVYGKQDTITFDLKDFADQRDNSLKDVLKKLPGVDVEDNGQVKYNGKEINRFTVEDLDLTGGRYNKLNETLKAKDVDKAEIIEHDQPIKSLQGKIHSDDVAMNIKLKEEARDKWMFTLRPALVVAFPLDESEPIGEADALQIGKKKQRMYDVQYDCSGKDLSESNNVLAFGGTTRYSEGVTLPKWFDVPERESPLEDERLRFNRSHNWSVKSTSKTKSGSEQRFTAGYLHTKEEQTTSNTSLYYFDADNPQITDEKEYSSIRNDRLYLDFTHNTNTEKVYGNEYFLIEGTKSEGFSQMENTGTSSVSQRVKVPELHVSNSFTRLWSKERHSVSFASILDFHHSPSSLTIDDMEEKLKTTMYYTDENITLTLNRRYLTHRYTAGITAEHINVNGGNTHITFNGNPSWQYRRGISIITLNTPIKWEFFANQGEQYLNVSPSLYMNLKTSSRSEWIGNVGYSRNAGDWAGFLLPEYTKDYRTTMITEGIIPTTGTFYSRISYNYKRPIKELFWNMNLSFNRLWYNTMTDMTITDGYYAMSIKEKDNDGTTFTASSVISKGFFDIHLKTSLEVSYSYLEGSQLSSGSVYDYKSNIFKASPEITFTPSFGAFVYSADFSLNRLITDETAQKRLFDWVQRLSYTQTIGKVDISIYAEHYRNELQTGEIVNTMLADAELVWRLKKVRLSAKLRNIFNKKDYALTSYSGISSLTNHYKLRPRELVIDVQISI
ncbi:MAG: hypothetical protein Q4D41_00465 [Prevotellaceae bacterium]|nr:hypothetical protein [Prevotellaceae bacterium]